MVEKTEQKKNLIIDNWEYLDDFLAKFIDEASKSEKRSFFSIKEEKRKLPSLDIIREKLWLYYYKEKFKRANKQN